MKLDFITLKLDKRIRKNEADVSENSANIALLNEKCKDAVIIFKANIFYFVIHLLDCLQWALEIGCLT